MKLGDVFDHMVGEIRSGGAPDIPQNRPNAHSIGPDDVGVDRIANEQRFIRRCFHTLKRQIEGKPVRLAPADIA